MKLNDAYSKNICEKAPTEGDRPGGNHSQTILKTQPSLDSEKTDHLLCRQCHYEITYPSEQIAVNGAHSHTFANPHGIVFEIGCFGNAKGCGTIGMPSSDFSWFGGYFWQIAICGSCLTHLGWRFTGADKKEFFGLIQDRLLKSSSL